ncbi:ferric-dicitrate binding protein FerR (iron transport regulator) [Variovorax sp. TBS-050B]|uniref:iron dicitrate transport regulator FecR n=1 Tax=Variovorax sp. TBS-050B TaxID=2940551 RepID=UPI002475CCE8|nr:iron dicitrate transport regulator FecR [Variovorax sp. TBS-050B]MDH6593507.1 ferric-dicitrate binding protein FerR (iron transport regulator) [Variovorax sp. TBS-050B]
MSGIPDEKLIERALALIVESESAAPDAAVAARLALARWRARSGAHAAAAQEARRRWDAIGGMAAELRKLGK